MALDVRQRTLDNRITNRLQMMNYLVLRFLGLRSNTLPRFVLVKSNVAFSTSLDHEAGLSSSGGSVPWQSRRYNSGHPTRPNIRFLYRTWPATSTRAGL